MHFDKEHERDDHLWLPKLEKNWRVSIGRWLQAVQSPYRQIENSRVDVQEDRKGPQPTHQEFFETGSWKGQCRDCPVIVPVIGKNAAGKQAAGNEQDNYI